MSIQVQLLAAQSNPSVRDSLYSAISDLTPTLGVDLFEEDIDEVIFRTNEFLSDPQMTGGSGPFWYIMQISICLAVIFLMINIFNNYLKLQRGEEFNPLKFVKPFMVAAVLAFWYVPGGVLDMLSAIPNAIGSYTCALYEAEAVQVKSKYTQLMPKIKQRQDKMMEALSASAASDQYISDPGVQKELTDPTGENTVIEASTSSKENVFRDTYAALMVLLDQIMMFLALAGFRIGWWGTIYCQQILLGMLTIFGPIQWAFSLLPKWENAWSKWMFRYLTVHFYGAMIYFVGFYVLLLFDIVLTVQLENMEEILQEQNFKYYLQNAIMTAGYLLVAAVVALKCLNLVPDLAQWMIPEGESNFSTRNFGEGVAADVKKSIASVI